MPTIAFLPAAYNLAETTRLLEIAKAARGSFDCQFLTYGGRFEPLIREEGFPVRWLEPRLTPETIERLYAIDRGEQSGTFFTVEEVRRQVQSEVEALRELRPAAVLTGFQFSLDLSARAARVPLVWVIQSTWTREYYDAGLGRWPDAAYMPPFSWLPDRLLDSMSGRVMSLFLWCLARPYNRVAREMGLPPIRGTRLWEGDHSLLAEPPEFCGLAGLPPSYRYIGPLLAQLRGEVPEEIARIPRDRPVVYFAMGSSGNGRIVAEILEGFGGRPYRVIAPVRTLIEGLDVRVPENVHVTGFLPAHEVNPLADISVIHGGIGTVMTAACSGTPVVGVGMQPEQEANLECLVRLGVARRIRKREASAATILEAVDALLADTNARRKAKELMEIFSRWDGPSRAADFLRETFLAPATGAIPSA